MYGLGTIINVCAIIVGGLLGVLLDNLSKKGTRKRFARRVVLR